ncbi:MAG: YegS/Rv2252/BmrU family lipid kinase [Lachnospiraceae bacterium]|jgi:diacylglycerol kinase (ATP)|nr:YegS/Rv2252/BmrU family lipid kinase [Lachnospiraceae bacterium]MCX4317558.1 YegS/Rv2252/BmrU family lipid kinase [Lachnospiraceae bacterium]
MERLLFIYNPNAGKGQARRNLSVILEALGEKQYEMVVFPTRGQGDAARKVYEEASDYRLLVCSGGDGTLNEAVDGLMRLQEEGKPVPVLGYIPAGTVNDFASSLKLPKNPEEAIRVILNGTRFAPDFGSLHDGNTEKLVGHFAYIAGFGAFTEVSYETPQNIKNVLGRAAYFLEGVKRLADIRPYPVRVSYEEETIEGEFLYGMVTNTKSVGGFKGLTGPEVCLDDGKFDVILIRHPNNAIELQNIINSLLTRELKHPSNIFYFHTDRVVFESKESIPWVLDGEAGGIHHKVTIYNHQKALQIMVPGEEEE